MSASPRIFVTGVSGYVGGHTVMRVIEKHPEWTIVALVRNEEQDKIVHARWPKIETIIGDLDDKELMIKEGSKADVVLRTSWIRFVFRKALTFDRNRFCRSHCRCRGSHRGIGSEKAKSRILHPRGWNGNAQRCPQWIW